MLETRRLAICDPNTATREPLRNLLLGVESIYLEAESNRYEFFRDVVDQYRPDVAIVTLDSDPSRGLMLVQNLCAEFPQTSVLAVSSRNDGPFILQTLRSGAKEFLALPLQLEDLLTVLDRIKAPAADPAQGGPVHGSSTAGGTIIAITGSRGGIGCTSLAVNLGSCLSSLPENKAVLVDLDLALGDTSIMLDFRPTYTLSDLANNIGEVDQKFLKGVLFQHSSGLMVLPHPENLDDLGLIHEEHVVRLLSLLRSMFTHVVVDLSKSFRPTDVAAMQIADIILLTGQLELSSIHNISRLLPPLKAAGLGEKVRILLNRVGTEDQLISRAKAEEFMGSPIFWQVANDSKAMLGARNEGKPLVQFAPKSKPCQDLLELARVLTSGEAAAPPPEPKKKSAFSFFGSKK